MREHSSGWFLCYRVWKMAKIEHRKIDDTTIVNEVHAQMLIYSRMEEKKEKNETNKKQRRTILLTPMKAYGEI